MCGAVRRDADRQPIGVRARQLVRMVRSDCKVRVFSELRNIPAIPEWNRACLKE